jgi:Gpi18-like mannosyltransferase
LRILQNNYIKTPLLIFLFSRFLIFFFIILGSHFTVKDLPFGDFRIRAPHIELKSETVESRLKHMVTTGDSYWYQRIAGSGYSAEKFNTDKENDWAFFPLLPMIMIAFKSVFGEFIFSTILFNNLLLLCSLVLIYRYTLLLFKDENQANVATWLTALHPTSYFYSLPVTEALFLILLISAFFLIEKNRPILSGILICLASATRATGVLTFPAFFFALIRNKQISKVQIAIALLIAPLGILAFMSHLYFLTGNFFAFYDIQVAWGRNPNSIFKIFKTLGEHPFLVMSDWNFVWLHLLAILLVLATAIHFLKKKMYHLTLLVFIPIAVALWTGKLMSITRFTLVLFPIYFYLGELSKNKTFDRIIFVIFASFLAIMAALYGAQVTAALA